MKYLTKEKIYDNKADMSNEMTQKIKVHLEEYLLQKGVSLRRHFQCLNPAHQDQNPSMSYNKRDKNVHCFSCGATYDIFDLIGLDYSISGFADQYAKACELFGYQNVVSSKSIPPKALAAINVDRSEELERIRSQADNDISYFTSRGITAETCSRYQLFQEGDRAYFPIFEKKCCVGWAARAIRDDIKPRYKNSRGAMGIWNSDILEEDTGGDIYLTEGIVDALCLYQMGKKSIALCGSQNTGKLLAKCQENRRSSNLFRFVLCGDPDAAGKKMNEAMANGLRELGFPFTVLELQAADGDVAALYTADRDRLERLVQDIVFPDEAALYGATSSAALLDLFFQEAEKRSEKGAISTGFPAMDNILDGGFYAGLYILGAISSLGKTSFILQIADYIAANGRDVLFFSLEQSKFELMAKSLSRISAQLDQDDRKNAFTARQLLSSQTAHTIYKRELLQKTKDVYVGTGSNLFMAEGIADIGVDEIRQAVGTHLRNRGKPPVVFLDYLQILKAGELRATDKQNIDRSVVELKRISRDFDLPIITISSFNRENYRTTASMEAFKESGAVEYSSDVLFGLQLLGAGSKEFDYNAEKARDPRRVELVMLKNRNGIPYAKIGFKYYAKFNYFEESGPILR